MNGVPAPQQAAAIVGPWQPAILGIGADEEPKSEVGVVFTAPTPARRLYIVVDELIGDHLTLSVAEWPQVDARGRARFPRVGGRWRIGARTPDLAQFLFLHRSPDPTRELRIGDVFAATLREEADLDELDETLTEPWQWLAPPLVDISAEARDLVKTAFYSAVAPALRPEDNSRDRTILEEDERAFRPPEGRET